MEVPAGTGGGPASFLGSLTAHSWFLVASRCPSCLFLPGLSRTVTDPGTVPEALLT